jgi:NAD(P)-dependent dehydrogenase (short-subunit alcohol dehydrogenase family)
MVDAQDIARMAVFLAGAGGRNISGQALAIDGDTQALV